MIPIDAILFDVGNVLAIFRWENIWEEIARYSPFSSSEIGEKLNGAGFLKFENGEISSQTFFQRCHTLMKFTQDFTVDQFRDTFHVGTEPNPGIEEILEKLNPKVKISIFSNNNPINWSHALAKLPVITQFFPNESQHILSFEVGFLKPSPVMFDEALKRSKCQGEKILYIDDNQEYVNAFRKRFHGHGLKYNCQTDSLSSLCVMLAEYDVFSHE